MAPFKSSMQLLTLLLTMLIQGCDSQSLPTHPGITAIAHAGGGINGKTYTNTVETMNYNYNRGFQLFEIDFSWANDGPLTCLHNWKKAPSLLFNYPGKTPLSLSQFKVLKNIDLHRFFGDGFQ